VTVQDEQMLAEGANKDRFMDELMIKHNGALDIG
jgi:hypothetical protein